MRALLSLLVVIFVLYVLSKMLLNSGPAVYRQQGQTDSQSESASGSGTSEAVRQRLNDSTESYQQNLNKSMQDAGVNQ